MTNVFFILANSTLELRCFCSSYNINSLTIAIINGRRNKTCIRS